MGTRRYNSGMEHVDSVATFRQQVYLIVSQVTAGAVTTYGQIAAMIPAPSDIEPPQFKRVRAQWVGRAMRHAPAGVPWHRVINSRGQISLPAGSRTAAIQRMRLEAEGILFDRNGYTNLERFGWTGPPASWVEKHKLFPPPPLAGKKSSQPRLFHTWF